MIYASPFSASIFWPRVPLSWLSLCLCVCLSSASFALFFGKPYFFLFWFCSGQVRSCGSLDTWPTPAELFVLMTRTGLGALSSLGPGVAIGMCFCSLYPAFPPPLLPFAYAQWVPDLNNRYAPIVRWNLSHQAYIKEIKVVPRARKGCDNFFLCHFCGLRDKVSGVAKIVIVTSYQLPVTVTITLFPLSEESLS